MNQLALFDAQRLARKRDPETSHRAAERAGQFIATHEAKITGAICESFKTGATYKEIARMTHLEPVAVARRLGSLGRRGLIERRALSDCSGFESRDGCAVWWTA